MFASAEKLYVCCIKTREREQGGERKKETDLKLEKNLSSHFELLAGLALNRLLTVKLTAMKIRFANGAKNKFAAFPRTLRRFRPAWSSAPEMNNNKAPEAVHQKCPPFLCRFSAQTWCKFSYFTKSKLTLGVKFIFIISLMHTLSDKIRFVQRKLKPEDAFTTKKWTVLAEHLLAQAHKESYICLHCIVLVSKFGWTWWWWCGA